MLGCALVAGLALSLASCRSATDVGDVKKGPARLVFTDFSSGTDVIAVINADGSELTRLTTPNPNYPDFEPAWSPDGKQIAFASYRGSVTGDPRSYVYVMNADGSNQARLTASDGRMPGWAQDGSRVGFTGLSGAFFTMLPNGSDIQSSPLVVDYLTNFSWAKNGKIVYACGTGYQVAEICIARPDGSEYVKLTHTESFNADPDWSPDGKQIVFARDFRLWIMDVSGANAHPITPQISYTGNPRWSTDGKTIAYRRAGPGTTEIHIINVDGSGDRFLVNGFSPQWDPSR